VSNDTVSCFSLNLDRLAVDLELRGRIDLGHPLAPVKTAKGDSLKFYADAVALTSHFMSRMLS